MTYNHRDMTVSRQFQHFQLPMQGMSSIYYYILSTYTILNSVPDNCLQVEVEFIVTGLH